MQILYNISRRGLTRVAYPGQGNARARQWDRREVEHPRLSRLTLPTQHYELLNLGGYRQNGYVYNFKTITLMKKLLFLFVLLLSSISMSAEEFEVAGIKYNVLTTSPDFTVEVTVTSSLYAGTMMEIGIK